MIKRFNEHSEESSLKKVWYIEMYDLRDDANDDVERFTIDNPENNGHSYKWRVTDPSDSNYPGIDQYFLDNGLSINEIVIIHSSW